MPRRGAQPRHRRGIEPRPAGADHFGRAVEPAQRQAVRLHLRPFEPTFLAMDTQAQAILVARGDLARLQHAARAAFETQQRRHIVVEAAARNMRGQFGAQRFDRKPRDMLGKLKGVRPDIAETATEPGPRRIGPPFGLLVAVRVDRPAEPALRIFGLHQPDLAEIAARNAHARLFDQRIAAIGEGQPVELAAARDRRGDRLRFGQIQRHRLFGQDVKTRVERRDRHRGVEMIRRDDRERFHPLACGKRRFRGKQSVEGRIAATGIESQRFGAPPVAGRVGAERTAYQFIFAIERGGHTVHRTDESALATTHHAIANFRPTVHRIPSARIHKIVCIIRF